MSLATLLAWWLIWAQTPAATPGVELSLAPSQPFVGQTAHLRLTITWPGWPGEGGELSAPWLVPDPPGWVWLVPLDQFFCQQQAHASGRTLSVSWAGPRWRLPVAVAPDGSVTMVLMFPVRMTETDADLLMSPAQLRRADGVTVASNRLRVQPRWPNWTAPAPGHWRLGIGRFKVQTEVQPQRVALGEALELTIGVEGPGVAELSRPPLTKLPALGPSTWRIESLPETWHGDQRRFRFRLWPVQPRPAQPLALLRCQAYDPDLDRAVDLLIPLPEVAVVRPLPEPRRAAINRHWADREPLLEDGIAWESLDADAGIRPWAWTLAAVVTLTSLWTCAGRPGLGLWPRWLPRPWSPAARAALSDFNSAADPAVGSQALITTYLRLRLGWTMVQPTAAELTLKLAGQCPDLLLRGTVDLWRLGDAARFGPQPPPVDWPRRVRDWLAAWEAVT